MNFKKFGTKCLYLIIPFIITSADVVKGGNKVVILVNHGSFASAEEAASGEKAVNFWDNDLRDDRACTECFAATELKKFLIRVTDLKESDITITGTNKFPEKVDLFILGSTHSNRLVNDGEVKFETDQSFKISVKKEKNRIITRIQGADRAGALYGVYSYLNRLGIHFYGLGDKGTVYPKVPVSLIESLDIIENPSFITRGFHATQPRGSQEFFLWMARNKLNLWTFEEPDVLFLKKLGIRLMGGGHIIQSKFLNPYSRYPYNHPRFSGDENNPVDPYPVSAFYQGDVDNNDTLSYFEAHPEWYGLRNGKRSNNMAEWAGDNFCTSNADAKKELAKNFINCLIDGEWKNADLVNFWMLDEGNWCECEVCRQKGNYTDRLFDLQHVVLNKIREARKQGRLQRDVQLVSLAYHETLVPPSHPLPDNFDYENFSLTFFPIERCYVHTLTDPTCTEINEPILRDYNSWTQGERRFYKGSLFIGEYYNVSYFQTLPLLFTRMMKTDIPMYYNTGARHFHYMHTPTRLWGTWTLNQYLLSQLLWNVNVNADVVVDGYFKKYYPTTTEITREFYHHLELATANFKPFKQYAGIGKYSIRRQLKELLKNEKAEIFSLDHLHYEAFHPTLNDGLDVVEMYDEFQQARKYLDQAMLLCNDSLEQQRLLEDERRFAYGEDMMEFHYHIIRTALFHQQHKTEMARREFKAVVTYAGKLKGITDLVQVMSIGSGINNGYDATYLAPVYDYFNEIYGTK